ncbi:MAG: hypothetical protein AMXMBFR60_30770 [Chloroflexota bacterium]
MSKRHNFNMSHKAKKLFIICILVISTHFSYDPASFLIRAFETNTIKAQFSQAQKNWKTLAIQNYSFEIQGNSESICAVNAIIEVKNNVVIKVQPSDSNLTLPSSKWADPDWGDEVFLCNYNHFTIPRMFAMLETILQDSPLSVLNIKFDSQYGFISKFEDGLFANNGWLSFRNMKIYNKFHVTNFQPQ